MSTQNLKIITALWGQKYSTDDVRKLPIDIVFSDREVPGVETRPINMSYKGTWKKMTLFDSRLDLGDCLFLDLDIILQKPLRLYRLIDYYYENKEKSKVMLTHVHWFDNKPMERNKSTYISCNVNSSVFAFNNAECNHIYEELVKFKPKLEMLFEGTDKWFYHKHKDWYNFFPDKMIQHNTHNFKNYEKDKAIIISENGNANGRNKV